MALARRGIAVVAVGLAIVLNFTPDVKAASLPQTVEACFTADGENPNERLRALGWAPIPYKNLTRRDLKAIAAIRLPNTLAGAAETTARWSETWQTISRHAKGTKNLIELPNSRDIRAFFRHPMDKGLLEVTISEVVDGRLNVGCSLVFFAMVIGVKNFDAWLGNALQTQTERAMVQSRRTTLDVGDYRRQIFLTHYKSDRISTLINDTFEYRGMVTTYVSYYPKKVTP
ncbi:MAG: hypothetical protein AAF393_02690 [Pseudomonadota bacterium]